MSKRYNTLIVVLVIIASAVGIINPDLYRDSQTTIAAWMVNDWVTLATIAPILFSIGVLFKNNKLQQKLVTLGWMQYLFYNYLFYSIGAKLNLQFPIYLLIIILSGLGIVLGLVNFDIKDYIQILSSKKSFKTISGFMACLGIFLIILWIGQWLGFVILKRIPEVAGSEEGYRLTANLDLLLVATPALLAAYLVWHKKAWGYVLATMLSIKGIFYSVVLTAGDAYNYLLGLSTASLVPLWLLIGAASFLSTAVLLKKSVED